MKDSIRVIQFPELVIAVSGPIGVDLALVESCLTDTLRIVGYASHKIKVTDELYKQINETEIPKTNDFYALSKAKISLANNLCKAKNLNDFMARLAIGAITKERWRKTGGADKPASKLT